MNKKAVVIKKKNVTVPVNNDVPVLKWHVAIIFAVCFAFYFNTLFNKYALDDAIVISSNEYTKNGVSGIKDILITESFTGFFGKKKNLVAGGRYRPLSVITFAVEYQFFGKSPFINHFGNMLIYAMTGILLYLVFLKVFRNQAARHWLLTVPFLSALLFIAHPLHTEVVANIKGRDELLAFLGAIASLYFILLYIEKNNLLLLISAGLTFFLGLMSKENTATYIFVIPVILLLYRNTSLQKTIVSTVPLVVALLVFLFIRRSVLGDQSNFASSELMNNPFLYATVSQKWGTIFYTLGYYIKLLIYPHPLTYDYYPYHIPLVAFSDIRAWGSLLLYMVIGAIMILKIKSRNIYSLAAVLYLVPLFLVSNILFPIGSFMNERFVYFSSIAFTLVVANVVCIELPKFMKGKLYKIVSFGVITILLLLYGIKTLTRNADWKDDFTLFTHDVKVSKNSAKSNCTAGGLLYETSLTLDDKEKKREYMERSLKYLYRSVEIHPKYVDALLLLGNAIYEYNKSADSAMYYYGMALKIAPQHDRIIKNAIIVAGNCNDANQQIRILNEILTFNPNLPEVYYKLGVVYGKNLNNIELAIKYMKRSIELNPGLKEAYKDLGVVYGMKGDFANSLAMFKKALEFFPDDAEIYNNMSVSFYSIGQKAEAAVCQKKALELSKRNN